MATLYYGSGKCSIEGSGIRGVEIRFRGNITIIDKSPEGFAIAYQNNAVMIFPINSSETLNDLFDYTGEFKILSVIVADSNAERVSCSIKRVMDYAELLETNAEDMTTNSEDLKAGYIHDGKVAKTSVDRQIIENLDTSTHDGVLYLKDGSEYKGKFHVHLKDSSAMTGSKHDDNSQVLYIKIKKKNRLVSTKRTERPSIRPSTTRPTTRPTTTKGGY
tara:strand:- start:358 stop:1011 length:654 start_codon:yes stop_codon:yes gene_type:complete